MPTVEEVRQALSQVQDPELKRDLVSLGMIKEIKVTSETVSVQVELTTPACPLKNVIRQDCEKALRQLPGVSSVNIEMTSQTRGSRGGDRKAADLLPGVKNVIVVASGKGGVGKSTVAINLAAMLASRGARTGLLDADIYGPSIPTMMGVSKAPEVKIVEGKEKLEPVLAHGVRLMSIGFFLDPKQAVVWRGPMLHKALEQFLADVLWEEMDYLVVDVPPGTGDVHLSFSQLAHPSGAILVTTPQQVAVADVVRGQAMFDNLKIPVLGVVENMSFFVCDGCGKEHYIFSNSDGKQQNIATQLGLPLLGSLPLFTDLRQSCDDGVPIVLRSPECAATQAFSRITDALVEQLARRAVEEANSTRLHLVR